MTKSRLLYVLTIIGLVAISLTFFYSLTAQAVTIWTPQAGNYQKQITAVGAVRYVLTTPTVAPVITQEPCLQSAKFKCDADWGIVFNLDAAVANQCNRLQIKKADLSDAAFYSGFRVINGVAVCP